MRIRYVVSTMVFWWRENRLSLELECQFLKSLGFGVELWPSIKDHSECRYDRYNWSRLTDATEGMLVSMRSRNDGPTQEQWAEQIECAKLLGANIVTDLESFGITEGSNRNGDTFSADIVKLAQDCDVKLYLETGNLKWIKEIGKKFPSLWYCLDVGYAHLDPVFDFKQYVDELAERTAYVHLSDNYGHTDTHHPPGLRGGITRRNWDYLLNTLSKYDNEVIGSLEMCPPMPDVMIRQASEFLFYELKWPNQPQKHPNHSAVISKPV